MPRKQQSQFELVEAQRRRKSEMRSDLLRVVDGSLPARTLLQHPGPWNEVGRGELPYEPFEKGFLMLADAARTARLRVPKAKQEEMRANIRAFLATIERHVLAELPEDVEADVLPLLLTETKVQCAGDVVEDLAKVQQTPDHLIGVARAMDVQARVSTRLKNACLNAANRGLTLVRSTPLQAAR